MRTLTLISIVLLLSASCTSTSRKAGESQTKETRVKVENQNMTSMTIYVLKDPGPQRIRLGSVSGLETRVFTIPDYILTGMVAIRLLADPVGSNLSPISEEFDVRRGDLIEMVIRPF